jgi:hypothetical protein
VFADLLFRQRQGERLGTVSKRAESGDGEVDK